MASEAKVYEATYKDGTVLASSAECQIVEGNPYFPPSAVKTDLFKGSDYHTTCGWKGRADYHTLSLDAGTEEDCAWSYPSCKAGAKNVEGYWAFYTGSNGITVKRK